MRKAKVIVGLAVLALAASVGWQVAACKLANTELQDDLKDMASQAGTKIGLVALKSDDDLRSAVIAKAAEHGIQLKPEQVIVRRDPKESSVYLAAEYDSRVNLLGFSFRLHFTPSSAKYSP
jgi:hypothetical protein